jgi:hypothetical protein
MGSIVDDFRKSEVGRLTGQSTGCGGTLPVGQSQSAMQRAGVIDPGHSHGAMLGGIAGGQGQLSGLGGTAGSGSALMPFEPDRILRERCLQMAVHTFDASPNTETLIARAEAFLKFVKGS